MTMTATRDDVTLMTEYLFASLDQLERASPAADLSPRDVADRIIMAGRTAYAITSCLQAPDPGGDPGDQAIRWATSDRRSREIQAALEHRNVGWLDYRRDGDQYAVMPYEFIPGSGDYVGSYHPNAISAIAEAVLTVAGTADLSPA